MDNRLAIIDLGTNTFHLLIVDKASFLDQGSVIYKERMYVFLGKTNGPSIIQESFERGIAAMKHFAAIIERYKVGIVRAIGTEALRRKENGLAFVQKVKEETCIAIEIIDGQREATLISKGVGLLTKDVQDHLIMDIGGGSVEFILVKSSAVFWSKSYPIGISVLHSQFQKEDPFTREAGLKMDHYLSEILKDMFAMVGSDAISLIGASGTFDVLSSRIDTNKRTLLTVDRSYVNTLYEIVLPLDEKERRKLNTIPEERANYIVVALHLVRFILAKLNIEEVLVSPYALKEGIIAES